MCAEVVAQLVEQLLPKSQVRSSNPVFGKFYLSIPVANFIDWITNEKKKKKGAAHLKKYL